MRSVTDVASFSSLLTLNTGVPFTISRAELAKVDPERYFPTFLERVRQVAPEFDVATVTRIFEQYFGLQVPAQQGYPLRRYDGRMLLVEVDDASRGLVTAQFRPHVRQLRVRRLKVAATLSKFDETAMQGLSASLRNHFLCMRDDRFVTALAAELALPHRIKRTPFQQAEMTTEQLQERIEQLAGQSVPSETEEQSESQQGNPEEKKT